MASKIVNPKTVQNKSRSHTVIDHGTETFTVVSGHSGEAYSVIIRHDGGAICSCPWGQYRRADQGKRSGCSHVLAVYDHLASEQGRRVSAWTNEEQAKRQHRPAFQIGDGVILTSRKVAA